MMSKRAVIICSISATILVTIGAGWARIGQKKKGLVWQPLPGRQKGVPDDGRTLREKARAHRNFVRTDGPPELQSFASLKDLVKAADLVVIGTTRGNVSRLSQDEKTITLNYRLVAEKVYKGNLAEGAEFAVSLPGGKVLFRDGSAAEVSLPWFKKMQNDKTYLLFLKQGEPFTTVGGPRGLFQIPTDSYSRKVQAHTLIQGDPLLEYDGADVKAFLKELKQAITKDKK